MMNAITKFPKGAPPIHSSKEALLIACKEFAAAARKADPSITGSMLYTDMLDHPGAIMGVMLTRPSAPQRKPVFAEVKAAVNEIVAAIEAETDLHRSHASGDDKLYDLCAERIATARKRLLAITGGNAVPEHVKGLALLQRRWLISADCYSSPHSADECALVDAVLLGTRFDSVRQLWHIHGDAREQRPSDDEFAAAMVAA